jgi:hypothetical protein
LQKWLLEWLPGWCGGDRGEYAFVWCSFRKAWEEGE